MEHRSRRGTLLLFIYDDINDTGLIKEEDL